MWILTFCLNPLETHVKKPRMRRSTVAQDLRNHVQYSTCVGEGKAMKISVLRFRESDLRLFLVLEHAQSKVFTIVCSISNVWDWSYDLYAYCVRLVLQGLGEFSMHVCTSRREWRSNKTAPAWSIAVGSLRITCDGSRALTTDRAAIITLTSTRNGWKTKAPRVDRRASWWRSGLPRRICLCLWESRKKLSYTDPIVWGHGVGLGARNTMSVEECVHIAQCGAWCVFRWCRVYARSWPVAVAHSDMGKSEFCMILIFGWCLCCIPRGVYSTCVCFTCCERAFVIFFFCVLFTRL